MADESQQKNGDTPSVTLNPWGTAKAHPFVAHYVQLLGEQRIITPTVFHDEITAGDCRITDCPKRRAN